jgi:hypothetical protein
MLRQQMVRYTALTHPTSGNVASANGALYHVRWHRHRAGGGFINIIRLGLNGTGKTRPYNTINHMSPIQPDLILHCVNAPYI